MDKAIHSLAPALKLPGTMGSSRQVTATKLSCALYSQAASLCPSAAAEHCARCGGSVAYAIGLATLSWCTQLSVVPQTLENNYVLAEGVHTCVNQQEAGEEMCSTQVEDWPQQTYGDWL